MEKKVKKKVDFVEETKKLVDAATVEMAKRMESDLLGASPKEYTTDYPVEILEPVEDLDVKGLSSPKWLVKGRAYRYKEILKEAGFRWNPKRSGWVTCLELTDETKNVLRDCGMTIHRVDGGEDLFKELEETELNEEHEKFNRLLMEVCK